MRVPGVEKKRKCPACGKYWIKLKSEMAGEVGQDAGQGDTEDTGEKHHFSVVSDDFGGPAEDEGATVRDQAEAILQAGRCRYSTGMGGVMSSVGRDRRREAEEFVRPTR